MGTPGPGLILTYMVAITHSPSPKCRIGQTLARAQVDSHSNCLLLGPFSAVQG